MQDYQVDYAAGRPHMYDVKNREKKAYRIIKTLEDYFESQTLSNLTVLDIGSSTGIIDNILSTRFKKIVGTDIDKQAVAFSNKNFKKNNLIFKVEDAMQLSFKDNTFDVVICTQVYEHVPNAKKLFTEIHRVLKPRGVCYLAALNKLWPWEPHYDLLFLSWLPKSVANVYLRMARKTSLYYENPETYWKLKEMTKRFECVEYTDKILRDPSRFGYEDTIPKNSFKSIIALLFSPLSKFLAPTFFWILIK